MDVREGKYDTIWLLMWAGRLSDLNRQELAACKRIVIKVGTSTLTHNTDQLNLMRMESLARELADLHNQGREVLLVSSGAIGVGIGRFGLRKCPHSTYKQALAAVGQGTLLHMYEKLFAEYGKIVAQVLLTKDDFQERLRYLNCRNTLLTLLSLGVIPIINENDTVAVDEIKFGDNDTLSALVTGAVNADLLIILSDIDGLYDDDPRRNPEAKRWSEVYEITEEMEKSSHTRGTKLASGGMYTKLAAARMVMTAGIPMVVANGADQDILRRIIAGEQVGTLFVPRENKMHARERWIAFSSFPQGRILVDAGARDAIYKRGKSLLPSGVLTGRGEFERGEVVAIVDGGPRIYSRYHQLFGGNPLLPAKKPLIEHILGSKDYDEVIHRNNLILCD